MFFADRVSQGATDMASISDEWNSLDAAGKNIWQGKVRDAHELASDSRAAGVLHIEPPDTPHGIGDTDWPIRKELVEKVSHFGECHLIRNTSPVLEMHPPKEHERGHQQEHRWEHQRGQRDITVLHIYY